MDCPKPREKGKFKADVLSADSLILRSNADGKFPSDNIHGQKKQNQTNKNLYSLKEL